MAETSVSYLESRDIVVPLRLEAPAKCKCLAQMALRHPADREQLCERCASMALAHSAAAVKASLASAR